MNEKILLVDVGNSRIKWSIFDRDQIGDQKSFAWKKKSIEKILDTNWDDFDQINAVYVSNVAGNKVEKIISNWCEKNWNITSTFAKVSEHDSGVTNSYSKPKKLGVDRWLAMIAAWNLVKEKVCVIDCGSAVTIDVINSQGQHQGGMISPGLALSARALNDHTHALSIDQKDDFPMLANNTSDAINSGCYHQFIGGIEYTIKKNQQQFGMDMKYIITGGDAELVCASLKELEPKINLRQESDLILQGLLLSLKSK